MMTIARDGKEGKLVNLSTVAERTSISRRYLEQIVMPLKSANLLTGMSGKRGGYRLARPAEEITIGEIIQASIGPINIVNCANDPDLCDKADCCECRPLYIMINKKIVEALNEFSLADLADPKWADMIGDEIQN